MGRTHGAESADELGRVVNIRPREAAPRAEPPRSASLADELNRLVGRDYAAERLEKDGQSGVVFGVVA